MAYTVFKHNQEYGPRKGRVMQFYVLAVAELYQAIEGGVVFTQQVLATVDQTTV